MQLDITSDLTIKTKKSSLINKEISPFQIFLHISYDKIKTKKSENC
jgi:hypothetical protein